MRSWLFAFLLLGASIARAEFQVPELTGPVVDRAEMLSPEAEKRLTDFLQRLFEQGGTQLQVLTMPDLGGLEIEQASIRVTDQWKLGDAKADNGVLLLIARDERKVRIEVGQGREGVLPDVIASRIIRDVIVPLFQEGKVDQGVTEGVLAIVENTDPEFLAKVQPSGRGHRRKKISGEKIELILFLLFFTFMILPSFFMRQRGFRRRGIYGSMGGFGSGGFGGGGGGGWSGGGGGFSGGGASGGW